jgi:HAD superfamily hydrolase (TIGR01509 family)
MILISAEEGLAKPDPQIYDLAAKRLEVQPEEAVFVDDFPVNIQAATTAGLKAILFLSTKQVIADVQNLINQS